MSRNRRDLIEDNEFDLSLVKANLSEADQALFGGTLANNPRQIFSPGETGAVVIGGYQLTPLGLVADAVVTKTDWEQVGSVLFDLEGKIQLLIGDWLVEAERKFGETYRRIADETGKSVRTLYTYKWVAENIDFSLRRENLGYSHYQLVAGMSDAERKAELLERAAAENWTVSRLRQEINRPALLSGKSPDYLRDFSTKKREMGKIQQQIGKAKTGNPRARRTVLGWITEHRNWLEKLEEWLVE